MTAAAGASAPAAGRGFSIGDTLVVARFELGEAARTKLLLVMILLFVGGGAFGAWGFSEAVARFEKMSAQALGAPQTRTTGASVQRLRRSPIYRDLLRGVTGDDERATYYASLPPMVVFFGWVSLMFTPWLVLFTASDTIASEVASRAIRYSTFRTGRLEYALGKALGQVVILAAVTGLCGVAFFIVAWIFMPRFEIGSTGLGILSFWPRVVLHALPFLAFALLASMITSSTNMARAVALSGSVAAAMLWGFSGWSRLRKGPVTDALWDLVALLIPFGHRDGFMYPRGPTFWHDAAVCLALTIVYFSAGFMRLRSRDL